MPEIWKFPNAGDAIINGLAMRQQRDQQNALAQAQLAREQAQTDAYTQNVKLNENKFAADQAQAKAQEGRQWFAGVYPQLKANPALIPVALQEAKRQGYLPPEGPDNLPPEAVDQIAVKFGVAPPQPFEQTPDYQKIKLQGQQAAELERQRAASAAALERQKAGSAAALERMKLQGGAGAGGGPPARPLPVGALKLVDEAQQAINASSESLALVDSAIGTVESGKAKLGILSNAVSRTKNAIGNSDAQSRAYSDVKQTLEKLRNNYLLLAKGVQTEGDATRAWNSEIGENVQNDNKLAAQQLKKAKGLIERAIEAQNARIDNVYANFGTSRPNAAPQAAPGGWSIEPVN